MTLDKRFHFVPAANLLITVPPSNDRLVCRRPDLDAALNSAGGDSLIFLSSPLLTAAAGTKLEHQIIARSRKGRITYTLTDGPDGLKVTPEGKLTWSVPDRLKGVTVKVVVTVGDASGDEVFHTPRFPRRVTGSHIGKAKGTRSTSSVAAGLRLGQMQREQLRVYGERSHEATGLIGRPVRSTAWSGPATPRDCRTPRGAPTAAGGGHAEMPLTDSLCLDATRGSERLLDRSPGRTL